jgi:hypothetical protein
VKQVLGDGMRWWVGNGESIQIWKDKWIHSSSTYRIIFPMRHLEANPIVNSLINQNSMSWNVPLLHEIFLPHDIEMILKIPLSIRRCNNPRTSASQICTYTPKGLPV